MTEAKKSAPRKTKAQKEAEAAKVANDNPAAPVDAQQPNSSPSSATDFVMDPMAGNVDSVLSEGPKTAKKSKK